MFAKYSVSLKFPSFCRLTTIANVLLILVTPSLAGSDVTVYNGLARTLQMGWKNRIFLGCDVSQDLPPTPRKCYGTAECAMSAASTQH